MRNNNIDINNVIKDPNPNTNIETSFVESLVTKITNIKNDPASFNNDKTRFQSTFNEDTNKITTDYR